MSVIRQPALCCQSVVMVCCLFFNFAELFDFGCCSLAQEMSFVVHYLPHFRQWLITACCWPFCLSSHLFTESSHGDQLLALPPFSGVLSAILPPLLCASFQFIVYFSGFFCVWGGQSAQGSMLVYPRGGWGSTTWCLVLIHLVYRMSPKHVWSQQLTAVAAHLFSHCNVVWRSFLWVRSSGCQSFDSPWCFISTKCGSSVSARFLIHGAHAVCFFTLVAILDPLLGLNDAQ
jgi:hypothetical protein